MNNICLSLVDEVWSLPSTEDIQRVLDSDCSDTAPYEWCMCKEGMNNLSAVCMLVRCIRCFIKHFLDVSKRIPVSLRSCHNVSILRILNLVNISVFCFNLYRARYGYGSVLQCGLRAGRLVPPGMCINQRTDGRFGGLVLLRRMQTVGN